MQCAHFRQNAWLAAVALSAIIAPAAVHAETYEVTLQGISFWCEGMQNMDIELAIEPGDTIRWLWVDGFHNVVSGFPESGNTGELFFSGPPTAVPGTTFEFTFNEPGVYGYHCHPHEELGMISSITVNSAPIPTVSEWGLIVMTLLALTAGTIVFGRRRKPAVA